MCTLCNKIAHACVTVWGQHNYYFLLSQNLPSLWRQHLTDFYEILLQSNVFTKVNQNLTHNNRDISRTIGTYRQTHRRIELVGATVCNNCIGRSPQKSKI